MKVRNKGLALLLALLAGCGTPAHYIVPGGPESLQTVSSVDPADWLRITAEAAQRLLGSGKLRRADGRPPVVMVSRIRNYTLQHLETRFLTDQLRTAINGSGQALVSSAAGYGGNLDPAVRRVRNLAQDELFDRATVPGRGTVVAPNLSLSGMIVQQTASRGRTEESYFLFHLVLTDLTTGLALWEHSIEIAKQGTRPVL